MSDDTVPIEELERLVDRWEKDYQRLCESKSERANGMAEGARSAAIELQREIERHT